MIAGAGVRSDGTQKFGERGCARGIWGTISGQVLLRIALSYTDKLKKYGA
jgi:2,3-bisphosphoglycerate-independent phosphoglycerate mutase